MIIGEEYLVFIILAKQAVDFGYRILDLVFKVCHSCTGRNPVLLTICDPNEATRNFVGRSPKIIQKNGSPRYARDDEDAVIAMNEVKKQSIKITYHTASL